MKLQSLPTTFFFFLITSFKASVAQIPPAVSLQMFSMKPDATYNTADVVSTYLREFSQTLTKKHGFQEYIGSIVDDTTTIFITLFDRPKQISNARAAANAFYQKSELKNQIDEELFVAGTFYFDHVADPTISGVGRYGSLRYYELQNEATWSAQQVLDFLNEKYAPIAQTADGFQHYAGILLQDPKHVLIFSGFDTREEADVANAKADDFVASSDLASQITLVEADTGAIMFALLKGA